MKTEEKIAISENSIENGFTHVIDWNKVNSIEDVKIILQNLQIRFDLNEQNEKMKKLLTPIKP